MTFANDCANCFFFRAKLMRKERKILRFVPQKLRKSFANGNPSHVSTTDISANDIALYVASTVGNPVLKNIYYSASLFEGLEESLICFLF